MKAREDTVQKKVSENTQRATLPFVLLKTHQLMRASRIVIMGAIVSRSKHEEFLLGDDLMVERG